MLKLPPESNSIGDLVESVGQLVAVTTGNEADDRRVPELRTGKCGDEVDRADEENTFDRTRECG